jgi:hypothetical protein
MDQPTLRLLIRDKLRNGGLPHNSIPRIWGGPGNGETCDVCEKIILKTQFVMEGRREGGDGVKFHVECFYLWDHERLTLGHSPSRPA